MSNGSARVDSIPGLEILAAHPFRVTRDAEYEIQELESDDLLETIEEAVRQRRFRDVVQIQVPRNIPGDLLEVLLEKLDMFQMDRFRFAALKLSEGKLSTLVAAVDLAKRDWRDLLMAAGFGEDVTEHERWLPAGRLG